MSESAEPLVDPAVLAARARLQMVAAELGLESPLSAPDRPEEQTPFMPLVTVVMPVFNDEKFVADALDSIRRQTYPNWECVVVDDASVDTSWEMILSVTEGDERFRVTRQSKNQGPAAARNLAIESSKGDFLAFLDGDDLMLPYSLEDRVAALIPHRDDRYVRYLAGSYSGARFGAEESKLGDFPIRQSAPLRPFVDFVIADGECPFSIIAPLVRTDTFRSVGGFDQRMRSGAADWELWHRVLRNGYVFVAAPILGAVYRQNGSGFTRTNPASHTTVGARLIGAAHKRVSRRSLRAPTSFPMRQPIGEYRMLLKVAERAVRFAAMALVDGKPDEMASTLSVLRPGTWPLLQRHLAILDLVKSGAARSLGVLTAQLDSEIDALSPFVTRVQAALADATR